MTKPEDTVEFRLGRAEKARARLSTVLLSSPYHGKQAEAELKELAAIKECNRERVAYLALFDGDFAMASHNETLQLEGHGDNVPDFVIEARDRGVYRADYWRWLHDLWVEAVENPEPLSESSIESLDYNPVGF